MFIDTHCHICDDKLEDKAKVVEKMRKSGVGIAIEAGCDLESSKRASNLSKDYNEVYFGAGIHPENAGEKFEKNAYEFDRLLNDEKCVVVGEIGLDYHYEPFDRELQKKLFIAQLEIAFARKLPVCIHCRDATEDMLKIIRENKSKFLYGGVMHCFSGSVETARELLNVGLYLGFGGTLTFKNSVKAVEAATFVPLDACLTETDSPYLAPVPFRGSVNEPCNIPIIAEKLACIKGVTIDVVEKAIEGNAKRLFYKIK